MATNLMSSPLDYSATTLAGSLSTGTMVGPAPLQPAILGPGLGGQVPGNQFPNLPQYTQRPLSANFNWHMRETTGPNYRYGYGPSSQPGDIPNVASYVNPSEGFEVVLDARSSTTATGTYFKLVQWTIVSEDPAHPLRKVAGGLSPTVRLPEGRYSITLTITNSVNESATATGQINVNNILIVSLGDSYASGEGMPHRSDGTRGFWANGGDAATTQQNDSAHRSIFSAPAQAAYQIEQMDPYSSVTFVTLAVSGATMSEIYSQVELVRKLTTDSRGQREIDLLFVSGGGNDVQFAEIVKELLFHDQGESLAEPARWATEGLASLRDKYDVLRDLVDAQLNVEHANVFVTGYPDPTIDDSPTGTPQAMMTDVLFWEEIDAQEILWAREHVLTPLEHALGSAVRSAGWNFVAMLNVLSGHGYSAPDNWIVTWDESMENQGNVGTLLPMTDGVMHPNAQGARAMAERLVGNVLAERALTFERAPRIQQVVNREPPRFPTLLGAPVPPYTIEVVFSRPVLISSFTTADVRVSASDGSAVRVSDVTAIGPGVVATRFQIVLLPITFGTHSLTIGSEIRDFQGNWLDQDQDGISRKKLKGVDSDVFRSQFTIASALGGAFANPRFV